MKRTRRNAGRPDDGPRNPRSPSLKRGQCGSWLACDAGNSVYQLDRGEAIAGKPAPTVDPVD
ncbi:hypothetical protein AOA62_04855 [Pseudomonas sp. 2995-3]|nr:hypothetical protein AOA62_04855 [Pseudomonas sp. 2995-3]